MNPFPLIWGWLSLHVTLLIVEVLTLIIFTLNFFFDVFAEIFIKNRKRVSFIELTWIPTTSPLGSGSLSIYMSNSGRQPIRGLRIEQIETTDGQIGEPSSNRIDLLEVGEDAELFYYFKNGLDINTVRSIILIDSVRKFYKNQVYAGELTSWWRAWMCRYLDKLL